MQQETDNQPYPELPGYKVLSELGHGGVATVYLAVQESLNRQVALKVMSPLLATEPDFAERFIREGRTVAQLSHPNIITVYDIGLQKHQLFIAMEYIPGGNMRTIMQEHENDPEWALSIAGQIALALGYAHTVGIVHRDVKPENILFRENGSAVLTDFGIAKTISADNNLTRAGTIIGTPKYMSPEQTDGRGNDPRTDIYSLGIILYELLTGKVPYDAENTMAILYAHVHSPIPELPDELSDLQPLLNNLLAKKVRDRSDDCDELAEIIRITRRERHYALKDLNRMEDPDLYGKAQQTKRSNTTSDRVKSYKYKILLYFNSLQEKFFSAAGNLVKNKNNIKNLAIVLLSTSALIILLLIFSNNTDESNTKSVSNQQKNNISAVSDQTKDRQVKMEQVTAASPPAVLTIGTMTSKDNVTQQGDPSDQLVSRFLADEQVKPRTATPIQEIEIKKAAPVSNKQETINQLLISAENASKEGHITVPTDSNAVAYYQQVLDLSPRNLRALKGLDTSGDIIYKSANKKYKAGKKYLALKQVKNALTLVPHHKDLLALKLEIETSFNPDSSFAMAEKLHNGVDGAQNTERANFYYRKAAELGHAQAMNNIAVAYADGNGVKHNDKLAMEWFERSAQMGNSEAMYNLALGYHFSNTSDPAKAYPWVKQSAKEKYRPSYMLIGWMTSTGTGVRASRAQSIRWDLKGMINPISVSLQDQYRIAEKWQHEFMARYKAATNTEQ